MNKELLRTIKFALISFSAGAIQAGSYALLFYVFKTSWAIANFTSLALSIIWNFTFNRKFTFKSQANVPSAMLKAFAFYLFFYPAQYFLGQGLLINKLAWNETIVEAITMVLNLVLEYPWQKYFVFKGTVDQTEQ